MSTGAGYFSSGSSTCLGYFAFSGPTRRRRTASLVTNDVYFVLLNNNYDRGAIDEDDDFDAEPKHHRVKHKNNIFLQFLYLLSNFKKSNILLIQFSGTAKLRKLTRINVKYKKYFFL